MVVSKVLLTPCGRLLPCSQFTGPSENLKRRANSGDLDRSNCARTGHWEPTAISQMTNTRKQRLNCPQAGFRPRARAAFVSARLATRADESPLRSTECGPLSGSRLGGRTPSGRPFLPLQRLGSRNPTVPPQCSEGDGDGAQLRSILLALGTLTRTPALGFLGGLR